MAGDEQYERGLEALRQADGGAGQRLLEALADVSPELSRRSVAWSYGISTSGPSSRAGTGSCSPSAS